MQRVKHRVIAHLQRLGKGVGERRLAVLQNVEKIAEKAEYGGNILFFVVYERTVYKSERCPSPR